MKIVGLARPYWKSLVIAFVALVAGAVAGLLEPWPLKVVIDNLLQAEALPEPIGGLVANMFGSGASGVLNFAVAAVAGIAIVGAVSAYFQTYLTSTVGQWVGHDLRRTLYHHIQRLSLADHDKARTGDLITRVTSDIGAVQSFIDTALLGILFNAITLAGMIGVMLYLDWRFTLVALAVMPVLFLVVYHFTRRIKTASRAVRKREGSSRSVLGAFLRRAKKQLLIYDPRISDKEMLRILEDRAKAGVEVKVIGQVSGRPSYDVQKLAGMRLHTRTIIRDRRQAFVGSQSLRAAELDSRREVGLIVQDVGTVKVLAHTFESDWDGRRARVAAESRASAAQEAVPAGAASPKEVAKAVKVFTKELQPLSTKVKKAVRHAVGKAGDDVLGDKDVKDTMKKVVKQAVKAAVKAAVQEAQAGLAHANAR
jgi:ABC-type multidrug transport system fused ATPase/permease subunit